MTFTNNIEVIQDVKNREEIQAEVLKKLKMFTTKEIINDSTALNEEELNNSRESIEIRFNIFIMNYEWEKLKTLKNIVDIIETRMRLENRILL